MSVRPSVRRSVGPALFSKVKSTHTRRILCRVSGLVFSLQGFSFEIRFGENLARLECLRGTVEVVKGQKDVPLLTT